MCCCGCCEPERNLLVTVSTLCNCLAKLLVLGEGGDCSAR